MFPVVLVLFSFSLVASVQPNIKPKILVYAQQSFESDFISMLETSTGTELVIQQSRCDRYFDASVFVSHVRNLLFEDFQLTNTSSIVGLIVMDCALPEIKLLSLETSTISSLPIALDSETNTNTYSLTLSASVLARGVSLLLTRLNWTRVGLVTDSSSPYSVTMFLTTFKERNITVSPYVDTTFGYSARQTLEMIANVESRIIYISIPANARKFICDILRGAFRRNMTWPHYAWIVYGHFSLDLMDESSCDEEVLERVILINQDYHSSIVQSAMKSSSMVYNDLFIDSIQTLIHSLQANRCLSSVEFLGRTGWINFIENNQVQRNILFSQIVNGMLRRSAVYNPINNSLSIVEHSFASGGSLPSSDLPLRYSRTIPAAISSVNIILTTLFVTLVLCLYVYYRKEKEVKATSVALSLLMFLGCYLLIAFLAAIAIEASLTDKPKRFNLCTLIVWLSGIALPIPLILATLLTKMLRIYKLFHSYSKVNKNAYKDHVLAAFVLLLIFPNLLILIVFSTDAVKYEFLIKYVEFPSHVKVIRGCDGDIDIVTICLLMYFIVLVLAVCIIAIKTRKLRIKMFSDTKKVNAFLFVLLLETVLTFSLWFLFEELSDDNLASDITLYTGTTLIVLSVQIFLFLPKVLPAFKRNLYNNTKLTLGTKTTTTTTSDTPPQRDCKHASIGTTNSII